MNDHDIEEKKLDPKNGEVIKESVVETKFDPQTGKPISGNYTNNSKKGLAIASLVLGIISILGCWIPFANIIFIVTALVGLGLGIAGIVSHSKNKNGSMGMSVAGVITSMLAIIFAVLVNILVIFAVNQNDKDYDNNDDYHDNDNDWFDFDDNIDDVERTFNIGEVATFETKDGDYTIKVNKVYETDDRNSFSNIIANKVVIVEYEYQNISLKDDLLVLFDDAYDNNGLKLEIYPSTEATYGGSVSTGKKVVVKEAYALNTSDNFIELEYDDDFYGNEEVSFVLKW